MNRRRFLRGMGAAVALPFFPSLMKGGGRAYASDLASRPRFLAMYAPCGAYMPSWHPEGFGTDFTLSDSLAPLQAYRDRMSVVTGLHATATDVPLMGFHRRATASWLSCTAIEPGFDIASLSNGWSIDQLISEARDRDQAWPSLQVGQALIHTPRDPIKHYAQVYMQTVSWRGPVPLLPMSDPSQLWARLTGYDAGPRTPALLAHDQARGQSVLDRVQADLVSVQQKLGQHDSERLEQYLTGVREVERRLHADASPISCGVAPPAPAELGEASWDAELLFDVVVQLLACDATRIGTMMISAAEPSHIYGHLGHNTTHHDISHHNGNLDRIAETQEIDREQASILARFVDQLAATPDGVGGTLLDNTGLLYGSGMGDGSLHSPLDLPMLTVGDAGGRLQTGVRIDATGRPLADLHLALLRAYGIDMDSFADSNRALDELLTG